MEILEFSKKEFNELILPHYYESGDTADLYCYEKDGQDLLIKKYHNYDICLDQKEIKKIKQSYLIPEQFHLSIIKPLHLVKIEGKIVGFTMYDYKNFYNINDLNFSMEEKVQLLIRVRDEIKKLCDCGIGFYDINKKNIMFDGKNILFCDVPDAFFLENLGNRLDSSLLSIVYQKFNLFTISYLNGISNKLLKKRIEDTLFKWSNLKDYLELIGVTDNDNCIDICYNLIYNFEKNHDKLLIDYINKQKIRQK